MELTTIQTKIHLIRGVRVMLDYDLAALFELETGALKRAVKRNPARFPDDFMFELSKNELENLRRQFGISSWGGLRHPPFAFTEHGVAMLATVLRSDRAVEMSIAIVRAFIAMRHWAMTLGELSQKVKSHDQSLADIEEVLRWLGEENQARFDEIEAVRTSEKDEPPRRPIGF